MYSIRMYEAYRNAADELNLTMTPADPGMLTLTIDLAGMVDGRPVHVRRVVGSGGFLVVECAWESPLGAGLSVSSAGLLDTLASLVGVHDLAVGDEPFDTKFTVKAADPARAKEILTEDVRDALLGLGPEVTLTDRSVSARYQHGDESSALIVRTCREVARIAKLLAASVAPSKPYR